MWYLTVVLRLYCIAAVAMAVSAAEVAPKAFEQLVSDGGDKEDVEDDLQVKDDCLPTTLITLNPPAQPPILANVPTA